MLVFYLHNKNKMTTDQKAVLAELYDATDIDMVYTMENDAPESIDDFMETLEGRISEIECIYYHNAMTYLSENDASLQDSIAIAVEYGTPLESINSELLATLLMQTKASQEIWNHKDAIESAFYSS